MLKHGHRHMYATAGHLRYCTTSSEPITGCSAPARRTPSEFQISASNGKLCNRNATDRFTWRWCSSKANCSSRLPFFSKHAAVASARSACANGDLCIQFTCPTRAQPPTGHLCVGEHLTVYCDYHVPCLQPVEKGWSQWVDVLELPTFENHTEYHVFA